MARPQSMVRPNYAARSDRLKKWGRVLRWPLSIALIVLLLRSVGLESLNFRDLVRLERPELVVVAILLRPVAIFSAAQRTAIVLHAGEVQVSQTQTFRAFLLGEMLSRFVPGNLGTVALVTALTERKSLAVALQLIEKLLFLGVCLAMAWVALLLGGHGEVGLVALGIFLVAIGSAYLLRSRSARILRLLPERFEGVGSALFKRSEWFGRYLFASGAGVLVMTALFLCLVLACGGAPTPPNLVATVVLTTIATAIPITINGAGFREWIFFWLLRSSFDSEQDILSLSLLTYAVSIVFSLVAVVLWALMGGKVDRA